MLRILGPHPLARDEKGNLKARIGTVFPPTRAMVTLPGIHATQRIAYVDALDAERAAAGRPPLTWEERDEVWNRSVDVIMENDIILIRPDPNNMDMIFEADELLQELVPKQKIKFLYVDQEKVRSAIKRRGEYWRISPLPSHQAEMQRMVHSSRIGIGTREIYYYNNATGTRFLTYHEFARLEALPNDELRACLEEIREFSGHGNRFNFPEIAFFMANESFCHADFAPHDFRSQSDEVLRSTYDSLRRKFRAAVPREFWRDEADRDWRNAMYAALIGRREEVISEESFLGLGSEFFMQIEWLPGGRVEDGELIFDPVFEARRNSPQNAELQELCDEKLRGFIFNFLREYGDLEYVNVGRINDSLSQRPAYEGRRDVFVAEIKQKDEERDVVKIIRMQKWGVREHLENGKTLLDAMIEAEEYTEYTLDRRLGCRQLGMNLPSRIAARKINERYFGRRHDYSGIMVWSSYFERDYIRGLATDKIPDHRFDDQEFALAFARLLGEAAAPNMIVGRVNTDDKIVFDDGDEVVVEDETGRPVEIVVTDHTGTFTSYNADLRKFTQSYAMPINSRAAHVPDPVEFGRVYVAAFLERFLRLQADYRKRKRAFDTLFQHRRWDRAGSFAFRWEQVLERLDRTDPNELANLIRHALDRK